MINQDRLRIRLVNPEPWHKSPFHCQTATKKKGGGPAKKAHYKISIPKCPPGTNMTQFKSKNGLGVFNGKNIFGIMVSSLVFGSVLLP